MDFKIGDIFLASFREEIHGESGTDVSEIIKLEDAVLTRIWCKYLKKETESSIRLETEVYCCYPYELENCAKEGNLILITDEKLKLFYRLKS
jgi:hypothetical protein